MELALPFFIKFFPNMLPSTFQEADKEARLFFVWKITINLKLSSSKVFQIRFYNFETYKNKLNNLLYHLFKIGKKLFDYPPEKLVWILSVFEIEFIFEKQKIVSFSARENPQATESQTGNGKIPARDDRGNGSRKEENAPGRERRIKGSGICKVHQEGEIF